MANFLDRNKKKSTLALLLLLLRGHKTVTVLLLLVALSSFVFLSPAHILIALPGGARAAAGAAWIAGKFGVDTSQWALAGGKRDYGDLLAAFRAAKDNGSKAGWNAFLRGGEGRGAGGNSMDFVKGSVKDLTARGATGSGLQKPGSVGGVLNPDDARNRGEGEGVPLDDDGSAGGGMVQTAFAGGFGSQSAFGSGGFGTKLGGPAGANTSASSGPGGLSGGAYAGSGLLNGGGTAGSTPGLGDIVKAGTSGRASDGGRAAIGGGAGASGRTPPRGFTISRGAKGKMSSSKVTTMSNTVAAGMVGSSELSGQRAFVQLAFGNSRSEIAIAPNCSGSCPGEFAATNTGTVYDGNDVFGLNFNLDGTPTTNILLTTFDMPNPDLPGGGDATDAMEKARQMTECADAVQACETARTPFARRFEQLEIEVKGYIGRMPNACDDSCECAQCGDLKKDILRVCDGELKTVTARVMEPCALPPFCGALGVTIPPSSRAGEMTALCENLIMDECSCPDPYPCCGPLCRATCIVGFTF